MKRAGSADGTFVAWHLCKRLVWCSLAALTLAAQNPRVLLETEMGEIVLELNQKQAPRTAGNFLRYVESGHYNGGRFHRTVTMNNQPNNAVKIEVIQGAANPARKKSLFDPIEMETTNLTGLRHVDGTLSMARDGPHTARDEFFICIGDQPELDFGGKRNSDGQGFAAFGRIVRGNEIVRRIHQAAAAQQKLDPPIVVRAARILR
jgi:peptidyl-prolyl cis-trans isomerase A (cyclophilin A)